MITVPPSVRAWIERELAAIPADTGLHYERRLAKQHRAAIIGFNGAYYFFLTTGGTLYQLDIDDLRQDMDEVTSPERIRDVLKQCCEHEPALRELLG
jgi:hypothetical protein